MPTKYKVSWPQLGKVLDAEEGRTVLDLALSNDIPLEHACGGYCACTTCHVYVTINSGATSPIQEEEADRLEFKDSATETSRLACQCKILGDLTIEIPK